MPMSASFQQFKHKMSGAFAFRLFLFRFVPAAYFAGVHLTVFDEEKAICTVPQKWYNTNPFKSIYFAVLSMAAEISTGVLCMAYIYQQRPGISMLVTKNEGLFFKKATGKIAFECNSGKAIEQAVAQAIATGESQSAVCHSIGRNKDGEIVAEFYFTWSFKSRSR